MVADHVGHKSARRTNVSMGTPLKLSRELLAFMHINSSNLKQRSTKNITFNPVVKK